ncbi:hypothetical protein NLJ89_g2769 [Agrocybe chaxingu]|uniref:Laccase n=1 Tax=Agrocybe chaxingu TaxID=84603 RepID=A0A9W8K5Z3_9AGAR|nr:hypothetical protein NLJ89_g2769 [Agrocybe chaxingu]
MVLLFVGLVCLSVISSTYAAIGPAANLFIANKFIQPDGFNRSAVLAGATTDSVSFPGPVITGKKGDTFRMNVIDALTDTTMLVSTSIHWHGFFQHGTNWADGPVGVNQCPLAPGHAFLYDSPLRTKLEPSGTTLIIVATQYCDGLRGALVVYDDNDPHAHLYDFDDESTIITLADWYHTVAPSAGLVPGSDATLINGVGRFAGGPAVDLAVINVLPNKRYRFRLISVSCDPNFIFSIDGHNMTIIEVDSVNVEPLTVDSIQIFAAQRYSFVLNTNQPIDNYWIRARPNGNPTGFSGGIVFNLTSLLFTVNNATFIPPSVPVLLQIMSGSLTAQELLPPGSVYVLPANKVIEISLPGGAIGSPHPIHLHGHNFDVIRSAGSSVYNFANPVRRDVVSIGAAGDNVTFRFTTNNAGPWIMHCHIDWHLNLGLAVVFAEDVPEVTTFSPPADWEQICPDFDKLPPQVFNT